MKRKNMTRSALVTSILALLLCVSMLVGTTFAWFTDSVESVNNVITAGNLDVEVTANGEDITKRERLFDDVELWEPGVVAYENLTVANVGTLALQYKMNIAFTDQNFVVEADSTETTYGLASVLKVAVLDKHVAETVNRDALVESISNWTLLSDLDEVGKLYPNGSTEGVSSEDFAIVIWWEPSAEDNNWNVQNGKTTTDSKPLHINLGINLMATQLTYEEDSYGDDYDANLQDPDADVLPYPYTTINATEGIGGPVREIDLNVAYQFLPSETYDEALVGGYGYWNADYVVSIDKPVSAESDAGLAGYYQLFCDGWNDKNWVALTGAALDANTPVRLVQTMLGRTVNYSEICAFGNDGIGFLCGAWGDESLAGATLTVELRLYETYPEGECPEDHGGHKSKNCETGKSLVVGTYTYTFPAAEVSNLRELQEAIDAGATVIDAQGANLGDFDYDVVFKDGTVLKNAKLSYMYGGGVNGTVTFENCEFVSDHSYSCHFDNGSGNIIFNNCTFDGWNSFGTAITNVEMNNCTFLKSYKYGVLRFYQNAQLNNCTFADNFEGIDNGEVAGTTITLTGCTGIDGKIYNNTVSGTVMVGKWIVDGVELTDVPAW